MAQAFLAPEFERATREVLAAPPFTGAEELATAEALRQLWLAFARWLDRLSDGAVTAPAVYWGTVLGLSVVAALLLWHIAYSMRQVVRAIRARDTVVPVGSAAAAGWLDDAQRALEVGEHRRAIELAWSAAVDAVGRTRTLIGRTPREQCRELIADAPPAVAQEMRGLLELHESACYAGALVDAGMASGALERARNLALGAPQAGGGPS